MADRDQDSFDPDDPLNQLLNRAMKTDLDTDRLSRLDRQWAGISQRRVQVQATGAVLCGAAVVVVALVTIQLDLMNSPSAQREEGQAVEESRSPSDRAGIHDPGSEIVQPTPEKPSDPSVDLAVSESPFERLLFVSVERKRRQRQEAGSIASEKDQADTIHVLLTQTAQRLAGQQETGDLREQFRSDSSEAELLGWIEQNDGAPPDAAWHLLDTVVTRRSVPLLMGFRGDATCHDVCSRLLARVADEQTLFQLAQHEPDETLRREFAAALLARPAKGALFLFLQLVDNRRTSRAALAVVAEAESLPVETLFQCLRARPGKVRLTAAMVLGRSNNPAVPARLVQMLRGSHTRRAAMVALVASEDERARQFVNQASRDVYLAASVHAALTVVNSFRLES